MKRNKVLPLALAEIDLTMLDDCRNTDIAFPPERSPLGGALMRYGMVSLLKGDVTIQDISRIYATPDVFERFQLGVFSEAKQ